MRKLFYENTLSISNGHIDWIGSVGKTIHFVYDNVEDDIIITDYDKNKSIVTYVYHDIVYKQTSTALKGCKLGKMLFNEFKYEIGDILSNKNKTQNIQILDKQIQNNGRQRLKIYKYKCLNCDFEGEKLESDLEITWCPCCCSSPKIVIEGINDIPTTASWMVPYFQGGYEEAKLYTCGSDKKIFPICPLCGHIKERAISVSQVYDTRSIGCVCGDGFSYPNKVMYSILSQLKIEFIAEYKSDWLGLNRFDFCLPHLMIFIEMDGGLGHGKNIFDISNLTSKEIQNKKIDSLNKDRYKDNLAKEKGYKVIRINADVSKIDYIKENILNSDLAGYFDLSIVDWQECDRYALKNIVKEVCCYYKQRKNESYEHVANKFHISKCTVGRYLKKGIKVGWITESEYKTILKYNKKRRTTYVYDLDFNLLQKFPTALDLVRCSKDIFGIQFSSGGITKAVKNHTKYYNKYYISYSDLNTKSELIQMINI